MLREAMMEARLGHDRCLAITVIKSIDFNMYRSKVTECSLLEFSTTLSDPGVKFSERQCRNVVLELDWDLLRLVLNLWMSNGVVLDMEWKEGSLRFLNPKAKLEFSRLKIMGLVQGLPGALVDSKTGQLLLKPARVAEDGSVGGPDTPPIVAARLPSSTTFGK
jgi:hypothetical protein